MPRLTLALLVMLFALSVSGCGQKGPLYRPAPEPAAENQDAGTTEETAEKSDT